MKEALALQGIKSYAAYMQAFTCNISLKYLTGSTSLQLYSIYIVLQQQFKFKGRRSTIKSI